jgi:HEAT repeat protein
MTPQNPQQLARERRRSGRGSPHHRKADDRRVRLVFSGTLRDPRSEGPVMAEPTHENLPTKPRKRLLAVEATTDEHKLFHESLGLIYDTTIYLASIALSEYRSQPDRPVLEVERLLARRHPNLTEHIRLFRTATKHTDGTLCSLREASEMQFESAPKLDAAMKAAQYAREAEGSVMGKLFERERDKVPAQYDLDRFFRVIQDVRNRGHGHQEESGFDMLDDFYRIVSPLLRDAALELLEHSDVKRVLSGWYSAMVANEPRAGDTYLDVRPFGNNVPTTSVAVREQTAEHGAKVLVHDRPDGGPELRGRFLALNEDPRPAPLVDEALTVAIEAARYTDAVEATAKDFLNRDVAPSPEVVDDLLVMVLEDFKLTTAPLDVDVLVGRLDHLLDRHSDQLPSRVIGDIDYFASLSAHARGYPHRKGSPSQLVQLAWHGTREERGAAIATLGSLGDPAHSRELARIVKEEPRSELRKHALLAIGRIGAEDAFGFLCETAEDHRYHPGVASFALRALSGQPTADAVAFLTGYLGCEAPYACLNAAAWSLATIFTTTSQLAAPAVERLLSHIRTLADPYTRGCLMYALALAGAPGVARQIVATVWPEGFDAADPYVLEDACLAVGLLRDPEAVPFLTACAQPDQPDPVVRRQSIVALGRLDTPAADEVLKKLPAASEPYVRRAQPTHAADYESSATRIASRISSKLAASRASATRRNSSP